MVCCVMNLRTVVLEYGADEFYWTLVFVLKHSLVCTLIRARDVCQRHFYGKKKSICSQLFHMGSCYFTLINTNLTQLKR